MSRTGLLPFGALLLLGVAIIRVLTPGGLRIRRVSFEAIAILSQPIADGETIERMAEWDPPADVYLLPPGSRRSVHAARAPSYS